MTINSLLLLFGFHPPAFARGFLAEEVKNHILSVFMKKRRPIILKPVFQSVFIQTFD